MCSWKDRNAMRSQPKIFVFATFFFLVSSAHPARAHQDTAGASGFGGSFSTLRPQQKRLVEDWFRRFSVVVKKRVDPAEGYDNLPLSAKTTFNAVTHALLTTKLTDASGRSLAASAMELVDKIDSMAGQILGARGDEQFRMYVQMKSGGLDLLDRSKEFERGPDNTVYHKGYPICFRSSGGAPSIQVSLTRDGERADIDVDYRSSKFPVFLVNGHLSASNSDVRAGDNDIRHNNQWAGLQNWWRNLLGLPLADKPQTFRVGDRVIATEPKLKGAKPADAIYAFLNGWLVEQKPNESIAYFADECVACMEVERGGKIDHGMARFRILQAMIDVNRRIGKISSLSDAIIGVSLQGERVKVIEQPRHSQFVLYEVREDLAEEFKCANKLDTSEVSPKAMKSKDFDKYVAAVFSIKGKDGTGHIVATLWREERDYWRMISYDVDPEIDRSRVPNVRAQLPTDPSLQYVAGDKDMIKAASDFLKQWLVRKDAGKALEYMSDECLACLKVYLDEDTKPPSTPEEARDLLKKGMARAASAVGAVNSLEDSIIAAQPHHQDMKLVKHGEDEAFVIASLPEYMGVAANCERRKPDGNPNFTSAPATGYGKYYAIGFSLDTGKTYPAVLWIVWSKVNGAWKAVSYLVITP
jgi:hypothetical protein